MMESAKLFPSWVNCHKLWLENHRMKSGTGFDFEEISSLIHTHDRNKLAVCESYGSRCIGEIYLKLDNDQMIEAETWIKRAMDFNIKHGTHWELARDHALYAEWYKKKGDISMAKEQLNKAIDLFRECGADGWVTMTEEKLTKLM
jgi:hypothetical protein